MAAAPASTCTPRSPRKPARPTSACSAVAAWRDAPYFTEGERAALALTEALTRISDRADPVPDAIWNEADKHFDEQELATLILAIANINVWNRLNVAVRQPVGVVEDLARFFLLSLWEKAMRVSIRGDRPPHPSRHRFALTIHPLPQGERGKRVRPRIMAFGAFYGISRLTMVAKCRLHRAS